MLEESFERFATEHANKIALVVTHSDSNIDDELLKSLTREGIDTERCRRLSKRTKEIESELKSLSKQLSMARGPQTLMVQKRISGKEYLLQ